MLSYDEFYQLMVERHKRELEEIHNSLDIEWKEKQLKEFEEYVKKEYSKYLEKYSIKPEEISNKNPLKNLFITNFLRVSVNNIIPAKISFYFLLSLIMKGNLHFRKCKIMLDKDKYYEVEPTIHVFWSQDSSSGKSEGKDFVEELVKRISKRLGEMYDMEEYFEVYDIDWTETPQTFINHFEVKHTRSGITYNFDKEIEGLFESTDVIFSDESAYLLEETIKDKQSISEMLLTALEGRSIDKTLVGWNGRKTTTKPKFLFYGVSRPITKMSQGFLEKGLFQRMLAYFREITTEQRIHTFEELVDMKFTQPNWDKLVESFVSLYQWKVENIVKPMNFTFIVWDEKKFREYLKSKGISIMEYISKEVKSWTARKVLITFANRYYMKIALTLFLLEAFSRRQFTIDEDVMNDVFSLLDDLLRSMILFTEYHLEEPRKIYYQKRKIKQAIFDYFKTFNTYETDKISLLKFLQTRLDLSPEFVEDVLYRFHYDGVIQLDGEKVRFKLTDIYRQIVGKK